MTPQKTFYHLLANTVISSFGNTFLWFCLVFWAYLETRSVLVTSLFWGMYLVAVLCSGIFFGAFVDHHKKKTSMILSNFLSFCFYLLAAGILFAFPLEIFSDKKEPLLWLFVGLIMMGVVVGNIRMITLSTSVTLLFDENNRDKANGLVGMANGITFWVVSVFSGLTIGQLGIKWAVIFTIIALFLSLIHLFFIKFSQDVIASELEEWEKKVDLKWTVKIILSISGLSALIFFTLFNNFLWGVFMSLMDPYGLSLVSVEVWWFIWWFLSSGFIVWGLLISKWGLGKNPLKTLLIVNLIMWTQCIFFTWYSSIILTTIWLYTFMVLHPFAEAAEQTILQKVVPFERQGRVFGFAQSVEQSASPLTAFFIGPITELFVIPFMASSTGIALFSWWYGNSPDRAMALVFSITGIIWLFMTIIAFQSKYYKNLSKKYLEEKWKII